MFDLLNDATELLRGALDSPWLWLALFVVAGLDALLPFMPSEGTVITMAVLLGPDVRGLALLVVVAAAGALAGDCLGHWLGRAAGPRTLRRLTRDERGKRRYEWARHQVHRHATVLIVAGRYLPGGRVASALATGSMRFPAGRFALLDAAGVTIWACYSVALGYLGGARFAEEPMKGMLLAFLIGLLVAGCVEGGRRILSRRGLRDAGAGSGGPQRRAPGGGDRGRAGCPGALLSEMDSTETRAAHRQGALLDGGRRSRSER
ncbi:membrane protein DedA with SNARE-associated domain [Prauserella shujinwangii]|uniref:Membrane protein DedA with SNARE-associated domain n=1 Tax=Prauserella shujinwangii TaxID=1453103 RepID=A0A2T0LQE4_9PSEU|nr:VTT domain-containing protein [Prauserella shujinwangii]PRX45520.1 membrane protein DedA with SNARE-associated domain [Prauserella shujinwangii]